MELKNKIAVITGASSGLGAELARKLTTAGAEVILIARNKKKLASVLNQITKTGGKAQLIPADITKEQDRKQIEAALKKQYPLINILVNNAGIWTDDALEKDDARRRNTAIETNLIAHIHMTELLLPALRKAKEAVIFNVISSAGNVLAGTTNNLNWKSYGASKWGMTGYSVALRESLKDTHIKVMQFHPGGFESDLYENAGRPNPHSQPWMMKTSDVADVAVFMLTRPADVYMESVVVTKKM